MKLFAPHATDFYKVGHVFQHPENTQLMYANMTARSDRLAKMLPDFDHKVVVAGIQGTLSWFLRDLWNETFFHVPKEKAIKKYLRRMENSLGENAITVEHIAALHDLGYLPLHVKALPEGSRVNLRVPVYTIKNTHPDFGWVTNYVETAMSAEIWKTLTIATVAFEFRRLLSRYALETGTDPSFVDFQGHDFSFRGVGGVYDAAAHNIGHLFSFKGTDTIPSIDFLEDYYLTEGEFIGGSVFATEHSVMCAGGKSSEIDTYRRLITEVHPSGIVSIVSDTWDYWNVLTNIAVQLRGDILGRQPNEQGLAKVVFRPDSGDPMKIICGDDDAEPGSPAFKGSLELLWECFGGTVNEKGYRELNPKVGLIYGDSITLQKALDILKRMKALGWASGNIVFGIGSFTYQFHTRDTFGNAIKSTYAEINGVGVELFKDPVTDNGVKKSAKGLLRVEKEGNDFVLYEGQSLSEEAAGELQSVFHNGEVLEEGIQRNSLSEIRNRLLKST